MTALNESQKRAVLIACLDIHRRMADMEAILSECTDPSAFTPYTNDLSPTERKVMQDYFARLRAVMLDCLREAGISLDIRSTSARWAVQCGLTGIDIAISEISPDRLRGYGPLEPTAGEQAAAIQQALRRLVQRVAVYLQQGLGHDLAGRLARLEAGRADVRTLARLERIISRRALLEFRPQLDLIVRRLEAPAFEIAVFGRVSSGKSSLLNHLVGQDILPVGVTPITAVLTRLVRGDEASVRIMFAEERPRTVPIEELRDYASEEGNPGNRRRVIDILVQLPAPRLREGIVLVDTPGTGSLARSGSAETFAYLPRCDLGVVLIDAAATLTPEELDLLRLLYEAGIPAQVLLSKADLLTLPDRQRMVEYVRERLRQELGLDLPVCPVSTVGPAEELLQQWFERDIELLLARHAALVEQSLHRKIAQLRESVLAMLQTLRANRRGGGTGNTAALRQLLAEADHAIQQARLRCRDWTDDDAALVHVAIQDAANGERSPQTGAANADPPVLAALRRVLAQRGQMALELVTHLQQVLTRTLESLGESASLVQADVAAVRRLAFRGLPPVDLQPLAAKLRWDRPAWAALWPGATSWAVTRRIEKRFGSVLHQQIVLYDRQLQAWLKSALGQLVELYEAQAEVFREQARRRVSGA